MGKWQEDGQEKKEKQLCVINSYYSLQPNDFKPMNSFIGHFEDVIL